MHGLGNDFVVINGISQTINLEKISISHLADRHRGIGFDQLLLILPAKNVDFSCRIFNSDGSEAEQCGNGMRCVARFILEERLSDKKTLRIETKSGVVETTVFDFENISVQMGIPKIDSPQTITINDHDIELDVLSMGNPHAILKVKSVKEFPVNEIGSALSTHKNFPEGINVGFMEVLDRDHIRLRTFERGAGETSACGTNSCAAVVTGIENNLLNKKVKVAVPGGNLWIEWSGKNSSVSMTGPAEKVFSGVIQI